ncbi:PilZ domain-containing protein [Ramlibacter sp. AN1015]|uniref:PilZ domain-containing protein n=1 Tax=Ramlibacter sp. AN1015 TaxID=3133428 RepID=UPI0030BEDCCA
MPSSTERRAQAREVLSVPLTWVDGSTAHTRDISAGGIYVLVDSGAPIAPWVSLELTVRRLGLRFRAFAQTLRIEPAGHRTGVAMRLHALRMLVLP